jgi:hypothetical protein
MIKLTCFLALLVTFAACKEKSMSMEELKASAEWKEIARGIHYISLEDKDENADDTITYTLAGFESSHILGSPHLGLLLDRKNRKLINDKTKHSRSGYIRMITGDMFMRDMMPVSVYLEEDLDTTIA